MEEANLVKDLVHAGRLRFTMKLPIGWIVI